MISRRDFLVVASSVVVVKTTGEAHATPAAMQEAIGKITGGASVSKGKVRLDVPPLIENGNSVVLSVSVDSPMTAADYVKAIHVFAPENPLPHMLSAWLNPRSGRARVTTRVRVADSQVLLAIAQLSDGSFWSHSVEVVVTLAACTEEVK